MDASVTVLLADGNVQLEPLVFILLLFAVVAAFCWISSAARRGNMEAVARDLGANIGAGYRWTEGMELDVDGIPGKVDYYAGRKGHSPWTRIRFQWAPPGVLRIVPEGLFATLRKTFGARDIDSGDPAFDGNFLVQGSPEEWVREVLDAETRRRLLELSALGLSFWRGGVTLDAGPAGVTLQCTRCFPNNRDQLETFVRESIEVFRRLRAPASAGIKILSTEELIARGECPVCGQPLDASAKRCDKCATPHHPECWDYLGGCAIFGCTRRSPPGLSA